MLDCAASTAASRSALTLWQHIAHLHASPLGQPRCADAVKQFGSSCAMPGALQVALVAAAQASTYEEGIRTNMAAGEYGGCVGHT